MRPFLSSLQLADSLFPSGSYTLSHGLESYAQAGLLEGDAPREIVAGLLRHSVGPADATALALAWRAAKANDLERIAEVDLRLTAVKIAREPRQVSMRLGRQLLALSGAAFSDAVSTAYREEVRARQLPGNQAVALGLLKAALHVPLREAIAGELYAFAASCAGAALRMALIDHVQVQRILHDVQPVIVAVTAEAVQRPLHELGGTAPFAELMTMQHEVAELRLFAT